MPHVAWEDSHYGKLGVDWNASRQEIRQARRNIRKICPSKAQRSNEDAIFFREVKAACKFLLNAGRRQVYDCDCNITSTKNKLKWHHKVKKLHKRREASENRIQELLVLPFAPNLNKKATKKELRERYSKYSQLQESA